MGALVRAHPPATPPIDVARALTQIALASGGRDNITVVVVDVVPSTVATATGRSDMTEFAAETYQNEFLARGATESTRWSPSPRRAPTTSSPDRPRPRS